MIKAPWKIHICIMKSKKDRHRHNTCSEFKIVNIHANAAVFSFIASRPNTQVQPSMGITTTAAFSNALYKW